MPSETPRRQRVLEKDVQQFEHAEEELEIEPTPAFIRCALGPTPQKNGAVLGIFDMLPAETPSKGEVTALVATAALVSATPSKATKRTPSELDLSRTPQSSSKQRFLEAFIATPLKRKREGGEGGRQTPSTAKRQYATPAFLQRSFSHSRIDEASEDCAASGPPAKKRGLVRSLSTIIRGLKKQEEERMDDEWDILNELEAEGRGEKRPPLDREKVLVADSQAAEMPLGPDQGEETQEDSGDDDPGALDANGNPRKVWKKKGLKRQTRRVIMRPLMHKPMKATIVAADVENGESDQETGVEPGEGEAHPDEEAEAGPKRSKEKKVSGTHDSKSRDAKTGHDGGSKKKARPQVLNLCKLKIKNKNSKANGRGGRSGRR